MTSKSSDSARQQASFGTGDEVLSVLSAGEIRQREKDFETAVGLGPARAADSGLGNGGFGTVDEHSGAYAYSVPIEVPTPLDRGPLPRLALTYNSMSSRAPSLVGAGWRLTLDTIERVCSDPKDDLVDFGLDQNDPDAHDTFHLRIDGMSFKLVPRRDDGNLFFAKSETGFAEARRLLAPRTDPISGQAVIDAWLVSLGKGTVYVFGEIGDGGAAASEVDNKLWCLTEIRGVDGQRTRIEYEAYADPSNKVWDEAPYPYPKRIVAGLEPSPIDRRQLADGLAMPAEPLASGAGDVHVVFVYEEGDPPSSSDGYGRLGVDYTGRPNDEGNGKVCVLWRRLRTVRVRYRDESGKLATRSEVRIGARVKGRLVLVESIDEVYFRGGLEDAGCEQPPHRFTYDLRVGGPTHPALLVQADKPGGARDRVRYARAKDLDPDGEHMRSYRLVESITLEAGKESWTTRYGYHGGFHSTSFEEYRGHEIVTVTDESTGLVTVTHYEQNGVHNGFRREILSKDRAGKPIQHQKLEWMALDFGGGRMLPFVRREETIAYHDRRNAILSTRVRRLPLRDPKNPAKGYAIDTFGSPEVEIFEIFEGAARGRPIHERRVERTVEHRVGSRPGERFLGLEVERKTFARLAGQGTFRRVEWIENQFDRRGRKTASTLHIDRDDRRRVYTKFRQYHPRTGAVVSEHRGDGKTRKRMDTFHYYERGPYRFLLREKIDAAGNPERHQRYDLAHRQATESLVGSGMRLRRKLDGSGRVVEEIHAGHRDAAAMAETPASVRHTYVTTLAERSTETRNLHTGGLTRTEHDALGRVTRTIRRIDGDRRVVEENRYDPATRKIARRSEPFEDGKRPAEFTHWNYDDPRRRLRSQKFPSGLERVHHYDGFDHRIEDRIGGPEGTRVKVSTTTVDARGLTRRRSEGRPGGPTHYELITDYDEDDRKTLVRDNLGNDLERTDYGTRIDDKPVEIWDVSRGLTQLHYGPLGQLLESRQEFRSDVGPGLDRVSRFRYDDLGRMTRQVHEDTTGARRVVTQTWDSKPHGLGLIGERELVETSDLGTYRKSESYAYDPFGLAERIEQSWSIDWPSLGLRKTLTTETRYRNEGPKGGRVRRIEHPQVEGLGGHRVDYAYDDPSGLLTSMKLDGKSVWRLAASNLRGQAEQVRLGNGLRLTTDHDPATAAVDRLAATPEAGEPLFEVEVDRDQAQVVVGRRSVRRDPVAEGGTQHRVDGHYRYDDKDQLVRVDETDLLQKLEYHPHGGRRQITTNGQKQTTGYGGKSPHQPTAVTGPQPRELSYDRAGNLILDRFLDSGAERELDWNPSNLLRAVRVRDGAGRETRAIHYGYGGTEERCFTYDAVQKRLLVHVNERMDIDWRDGPGGSPVVHTHVHNGARRVATLSERRGEPAQLHYYHRDPVHSVCCLTDATGGVVWSARLAPFGKVLEESGERPDILFGGHRVALRDEQGFEQYEMRARHYDPELGIFVSADPNLDENNVAFGTNRYVYCRNSPLTFYDETGFETQNVGLAVVHSAFLENKDSQRYLNSLQSYLGEGFSAIALDPSNNDAAKGIVGSVSDAFKSRGRNIKYLVVDGHSQQAETMMWYLEKVAHDHDVVSVTSLGCSGFGPMQNDAFKNLEEINSQGAGNLKDYWATNHSVYSQFDDEAEHLHLFHGDELKIEIDNVRQGKDPFLNDKDTTVNHGVATEEKRVSKASKGTKTMGKVLSKTGAAAMGALNVAGVVNDVGELADAIRRGDVEETGKKAGTMIAGRVPGGDVAFEVGYSIGEAINEATDNYIPNKIAEVAEAIGVHKAIYHVATWLGIW